MISESHLAARLARAGSVLGQGLMEAAHLSLRQYLLSIMRPISPPASDSLTLLLNALEKHLVQLGIDSPDEWCEALLQRPLMQQADHSSLILDEETFLNNTLFALAAKMENVPRVITVQCSSVSCISSRRPYRGPPILHTRGAEYNVFGKSRRAYSRSTFVAMPPPYTTVFLPTAVQNSLREDPLVGQFVGRSWSNPLEAVQIINSEIWQLMGGRDLADVLFLDDRFSSELVAQHLSKPQSSLYRLIFEPALRSMFLSLKHEWFNVSPSFVRSVADPDFFWVRHGSRLLPVTIKADELWCNAENYALPIALTGTDIVAAIRSGRLVPDRLLIYFVRCILPGVRAVGGTSQQDSVHLYSRLLLDVDNAFGFLDRSERINAECRSISVLGGAPLIELTPDTTESIRHVGRNAPLERWYVPYMERPIGEVIGNLACAGYMENGLQRVRESK